MKSYYTLSQLRYDEGYTSYLTLLDAIRNLFEAQIDLVQAQNENFASVIGLYRAMGGGWIVQAEQKDLPEQASEASFFP